MTVEFLPMGTSAIDEAILSAIGERWTKVAMVIARVADAMARGDKPLGDEDHEAIARRIAILVRKGHLAAQGDLKRWRSSEVRRAQRAD